MTAPLATPARRLASPSSVNAAIRQIADVMRRANYAGALQYVPELSWILFLRILDEPRNGGGGCGVARSHSTTAGWPPSTPRRDPPGRLTTGVPSPPYGVPATALRRSSPR
jgi:hypothetical protein